MRYSGASTLAARSEAPSTTHTTTPTHGLRINDCEEWSSRRPRRHSRLVCSRPRLNCSLSSDEAFRSLSTPLVAGPSAPLGTDHQPEHAWHLKNRRAPNTADQRDPRRRGCCTVGTVCVRMALGGFLRPISGSLRNPTQRAAQKVRSKEAVRALYHAQLNEHDELAALVIRSENNLRVRPRRHSGHQSITTSSGSYRETSGPLAGGGQLSPSAVTFQETDSVMSSLATILTSCGQRHAISRNTTNENSSGSPASRHCDDSGAFMDD